MDKRQWRTIRISNGAILRSVQTETSLFHPNLFFLLNVSHSSKKRRNNCLSSLSWFFSFSGSAASSGRVQPYRLSSQTDQIRLNCRLAEKRSARSDDEINRSEKDDDSLNESRSIQPDLGHLNPNQIEKENQMRGHRCAVKERSVLSRDLSRSFG